VGFDNDKRFESVYSRKVKAGKRRTYFFDVRQTKSSEYFVTITESTKRFEDDGYSRHKIFLYKEDFNRFVENLNDVVDHVKKELMPEYDYEEYARRYDEEEFIQNDFPKTVEETEKPIIESDDSEDGETW
jgi:hypothetical protein